MKADKAGTEIVWLTKNQIECKLSLGTKGVIQSWYDVKEYGVLDDTYIPDSRRFSLSMHHVQSLFTEIQTSGLGCSAERLKTKSSKYGEGMDVFIWGFMYQEVLRCWRIISRGGIVQQMWYLVEQKDTEYPSDPMQDPIVKYFVGTIPISR